MLLKNILTYLCVSGQKPNHIKSEPIGLRTCVSYPNALLLAQPAFVNITKVNKSYQVVCHSCKLTNCITSAEPKDLNVLLVVRRTPFVIWCDLGGLWLHLF